MTSYHFINSSPITFISRKNYYFFSPTDIEVRLQSTLVNNLFALVSMCTTVVRGWACTPLSHSVTHGRLHLFSVMHVGHNHFARLTRKYMFSYDYLNVLVQQLQNILVTLVVHLVTDNCRVQEMYKTKCTKTYTKVANQHLKPDLCFISTIAHILYSFVIVYIY